MKINKYLALGVVALGLGMTSCVNDLDLEPIDPSQIFANPSDPEFVANSFAECYAMFALSSTSDPGTSNLSAPNAGASVYVRVLFNINEFPTDEAFWIWEDNGIREMISNTFSANNKQVEVCYSRLFQHLSICNTFLAVTEDQDADPEVGQMRDEVRLLRAMTYYWICDIFGNVGFTISEPDGKAPEQIRRPELYAWLVQELTELADNSRLSNTPVYGRVGKDAAEALLARVYLNAEVYTTDPANGVVGTPAWDKCLERCNNVINRHKGAGFNGSGLANHYLYLFCGNNEEYMPGGGNTAENEIIWGVPFDADHIKSYGGSTFLMAGSLSAGELGMTGSWSCMTARQQLSERFDLEPQDIRCSLWKRENRTPENQAFLDYDVAGYQALKWTNLTHTTDGNFSDVINSAEFGNADLALIRLADIYLMRAECYLHGKGNLDDALDGVNFVRERAGVSPWTAADLTADNLLDERSRELYFELTRRSDLIRFGKYIGSDQVTWSWKGNTLAGTTIGDRYLLMPIPTNILAAQPELVQNMGY